MKIFVHRINEPGDSVEFLLPGDRFQSWFDDRPDLVSFSPGAVRLDIERIDQIITLHGVVHFGVEFLCGRCGDQFEADLEMPVHMVLSPRPEDELEVDEDEGTGYHDGREIDLGLIVLEQVALAMPGVLHCSPDCQGVAPKSET